MPRNLKQLNITHSSLRFTRVVFGASTSKQLQKEYSGVLFTATVSKFIVGLLSLALITCGNISILKRN